MPAIFEADDDGLYVLKYRGAGLGTRALVAELVAELVAGAIAEALELPLPERVFGTLDRDVARTEGDPEIQALVRASAGTNLALDSMLGAANFDVAVDSVDADLASQFVWFDASISNIDRTAGLPSTTPWS